MLNFRPAQLSISQGGEISLKSAELFSGGFRSRAPRSSRPARCVPQFLARRVALAPELPPVCPPAVANAQAAGATSARPGSPALATAPGRFSRCRATHPPTRRGICPGCARSKSACAPWNLHFTYLNPEKPLFFGQKAEK